MPKKYFDRLQNIDRLIQIKGTGTPKEFAQRLNISERRLYELLTFMKDTGAPIAYCRQRCSYYYEQEGSFNLQFISTSRPKEDKK